MLKTFFKASVVLLGFVVHGCNADDRASQNGVSSEFTDYQLTIESADEIANVANLFKDVAAIKLSPGVAEYVGSIFHFFVVDSVGIVLVDEISRTITRLNNSGGIVWQISARSDDYRYFNSIEEFTFDQFNRRIIVYDDSRLFAYDLDGRPLGVEAVSDFDYNQMVSLSREDVFYSTQGYINGGLSDKPKQLVWVKNGRIQKSFVEKVFQDPPFTFVGGMNEFNFLKGEVHYHAALRDSFYKIDFADVSPAFTFSFNSEESTDELMRDKMVARKLSYISKNNVPFVINLAADDDNVLVSYKKAKSNYVAILDREVNEWLLNNQYLRYHDLVFRAPSLYWNGYFLIMIPEYRVKHFSKIPDNVTAVSEHWKEELEKLDESYDGLGAKTLYLLKY